MARTYEVYLRDFKPTCNFFYDIDVSVSKFKKLDKKQRNDVSDIFTSEDMENISLVSRM